MATIVRVVHKDGKVTYKARVRRKGWPERARSFDTKAAALAWARDREVAIDRTSAPEGENTATQVTLADILVRYRDEVTPQHRGRVIETDRINFLLQHPIARVKMHKLSTTVLAGWRDWRLIQVSDGTLLREINVLRAVVNRARREWGVQIECPFRWLSRPKQPAARERRLRTGELDILYRGCLAAKNPYLRPSIDFALATGMRQGEIVSLLWENVDLSARMAWLPMTKNGKGRKVPLSTRAVEILMSLPTASRRRGLVFAGWNGNPEVLKMSFVRLTRRTGVQDFHFHDLRHECLSRLAEAGWTAFELRLVSGHDSLEVLKRYVNLQPEQVVEKLG